MTTILKSSFMLLLWAISTTALATGALKFEAYSNERFDKILDRLSSYTPRENIRRLSDYLNDDEPLPSMKLWTIECKSPGIFFCPGCLNSLRQEQSNVIKILTEMYPAAKLKSQTEKLANAIYVGLPSDATIPTNMEEIKRFWPSQTYTLQQLDTVEYTGGKTAQQTYCATGKNLVVGVLDTGIDYTHKAFGGEGTKAAYDLAYTFFPTNKVINGYDFVGDDNDIVEPDDDPIDSQGHGTLVASAINAVAPDVKFIAAKSCLGQAGLCPEDAIVLGLEFVLDPNRDGVTDDRVDVINISIAMSFKTTFFDMPSLFLEYASLLGAVVVVAFGNEGNIPYVAGGTSSSPNVLAVGSTNHPTELTGSRPFMKDFSSRGPGDNNIMKPDISAPSNSLLAVAGTGTGYERAEGTSVSAPFVAGAAVLLKERCPGCSPFAIRSILMNTADRDVQYSEKDDRLAPVTRMGSGELRIDRAIETRFWAYCLEDVQPVVALGLIDASEDIIYQRTIVLHSLDPTPKVLTVKSEFRSPEKKNSGAVVITFDPLAYSSKNEKLEITTIADCSSPITFKVSFFIHSALAPQNTMTSGGQKGYDTESLDRHEWDGHIIIASEDQEIAVPFHMLLRQAAAPRLAEGTIFPFTYGPVDKNLTITNHGAGVAQIDAFALIYSGIDIKEGDYGSDLITTDVRTIGYRTVPVNEPGCDFLVEFSFQTWERTRHAGLRSLRADIYPDVDEKPLTLWLPTVPHPSESHILDRNGTNHCTGLPVDHSSNSANTILRACSNDLLLTKNSTGFYVKFYSYAYPIDKSSMWTSDLIDLRFPNPRLQAHSYDIAPGETLTEFLVTGVNDQYSHGLQLVTNAFRGYNRTGAATRETETLNVVQEGIILESEQTPDIYPWPILEDLTGPECGWTSQEIVCEAPSVKNDESHPAVKGATPMIRSSGFVPAQDNDEVTIVEVIPCPPMEVTRLQVPTHLPTASPSFVPTPPPGSTPSPTGEVTPIPTSNQRPSPTRKPLPPTPLPSPTSNSKARYCYSYGVWLAALTIFGTCFSNSL